MAKRKLIETEDLFKIDESDLISEEQYNNAEYCEFVLLSIIINNCESEFFFKAFDVLGLDDFISPFSKKLFKILIDLTITQSLKIDKSTVSSQLSEVERPKLDEILGLNVSKDNLTFFTKRVKNFAQLRNLKTEINKTSLDLETENIEAPKLIAQLESSLLRIVSNNYTDFSLPKDILPKILDRMKRENVIGVSTSFGSLDELTNGLTGYITIASRPSLGKSELSLNIMIHNALLGKRSAMFSLEMDEISLTERIISNITEIPAKKLKTGTLNSNELKILENSIPIIENLPIHIDQSGGITIGQIASKTKRLKIKYPDLALIIIDYIQLISTTNDSNNQEEHLSNVSRTIKNLSQSLNIPVVALSQLNRLCEAREDKRPRLSDLRSSGAIEQNSDMVIFLYGDWYYNKSITNKITELILSKNRNGAIGTVIVDNDIEIQKFREL